MSKRALQERTSISLVLLHVQASTPRKNINLTGGYVMSKRALQERTSISLVVIVFKPDTLRLK